MKKQANPLQKGIDLRHVRYSTMHEYNHHSIKFSNSDDLQPGNQDAVQSLLPR